MTTTEDASATIAGALRDAFHKTGDLMDSAHLHSLAESGHGAASQLVASAPDLISRPGSAAPFRKVRISTARKLHELAQSIDHGADALAPKTSGHRRWSRWFLVLALVGVAAVFLGRKLRGATTEDQRVVERPVEERPKEPIVEHVSTRITQGETADPLVDRPGTMSDASGARA